MLVMFDHNKANTLQAGVNYLVQMHIGVAFLTIAFIWMFVASDLSIFRHCRLSSGIIPSG